MKRTDEHVTSYLFAELGTSGSVDGSRRLVIKGRFQQKQIENVLRRYISMFHPFPLYLLTIAKLSQWSM
jgi:translation initiation factor 2 subunit 2